MGDGYVIFMEIVGSFFALPHTGYKGLIYSQGQGRSDKGNKSTNFYKLSGTTDTLAMKRVISDSEYNRRLNSLTLTLNDC